MDSQFGAQPKAVQPIPKKREDSIKALIGAALSQLNQRMSIVEERIDNLRGHIELVENNLITKDKEATKEINALSLALRDLRGQIKELNESLRQLSNKLNYFATREQVKVLERYINMWSPLEYVSKKEVEDLIEEKLKEVKSSNKSDGDI